MTTVKHINEVKLLQWIVNTVQVKSNAFSPSIDHHQPINKLIMLPPDLFCDPFYNPENEAW